ncbi:IS3 family transposase [Caproiciproducens sp. AGMB10547]|uniref:IS3 family transposase n=1 Tax=Caproiciproducens faecalis TaxID=2820301 RepID=A0ABS7DMB3_9FIRM|nr:IS3 family transposase [Caproiciproducens faecalis]
MLFKKRGRCRAATPQRPRVSIHLASIFYPDSTVRHNSLDVKTRNCYENAMAENFFSILKTECIYRRKLKTFEEAMQLIR